MRVWTTLAVTVSLLPGMPLAQPTGALDIAPSPADAAVAPVSGTAMRPGIATNRWTEDWSVLADPALRSQPLDSLKYIALSDGDADLHVDEHWRAFIPLESARACAPSATSSAMAAVTSGAISW